jgi:hypothetical protein
VVAAIWLASGGLAGAETRGLLRLGVEPLALEPSADTPFVGGHVDDAVSAYNAAATSYNRLHGLPPGSAMASAPIDHSALGLHTTLVTFAPGLEAGGRHVRFRVEALLGISAQVRALGLGVYPLDLAFPVRRGTVTPYVVAGGTARWLDRAGGGEIGGLVTLRAAAGARLGRHVAVELGCGLFMLGGLYDEAQLDSMSSYDPRGAAPPPAPDRAVAGGEQSGMIDVSISVAL